MADTTVDRIPPTQDAGLTAIWKTHPGFVGWLSSVDHKEIGKRYLITAFLFLLIGGLEALIMRAQLARPNQTLLTPGQYNQLFTMHGVTMVFLYALPMLSGFSNYLWPLLLGSRDMAFPRLNAFSYWVFLASGIFIYSTFLIGQAPNAGWFSYTPLSGKEYDPGLNIDVYALGLIFLGVSTTVGAINFIVSLMRTRAPGMSINRMPILVWGTLTASVANLFAVPALSAACLLLWLDRTFGMHFFDPQGGGQPILWQHLFWVFGHPWVYALVLPAMSIVSDALPTFCRRPLVGYTAVALATVTTMVLGFGVWVHHMFATGLPGLALSFFGAASMIIAIPSAVSVFAWIGTIWTGRPVFKTPFLYFAGFILLFVIGMLANTLRQLSFVVRDKMRKDRASGTNVAKAILALLFLLPSLHAFAEGAEVKAQVAESIAGIPATDYYFIVGTIGLEVLVIFALTIYVNLLLTVIRNKPELEAKAKAVIRKSWFWDKFNSASSIEKEKDILLDHDYDGIRELDNSLPPWWKYGFYLTIIVACIYLYRFHISHDGMSQKEEYLAEMQKGEEDKAAYLAKSANNIDENNVTLSTDPAVIAAGKETFLKNCVACHLADGGGVVGPNLTDEYWLHGGGVKDIFKSIKYGWQDKGMKSWKDDLSPKQIQELACFIKSLKGTHPASPKAPQGDLYIEASQTPKQDSTRQDSTKSEKVVKK